MPLFKLADHSTPRKGIVLVPCSHIERMILLLLIGNVLEMHLSSIFLSCLALTFQVALTLRVLFAIMSLCHYDPDICICITFVLSWILCTDLKNPFFTIPWVYAGK